MLLDTRSVPLVAISLFLTIGPSCERLVRAALGWPFLLRVRAMTRTCEMFELPLITCRLVATGMTLLPKWFSVRVCVACTREVNVNLLRLLWETLNPCVINLVALNTGTQVSGIVRTIVSLRLRVIYRKHVRRTLETPLRLLVVIILTLLITTRPVVAVTVTSLDEYRWLSARVSIESGSLVVNMVPWVRPELVALVASIELTIMLLTCLRLILECLIVRCNVRFTRSGDPTPPRVLCVVPVTGACVAEITSVLCTIASLSRRALLG